MQLKRSLTKREGGRRKPQSSSEPACPPAARGSFSARAPPPPLCSTGPVEGDRSRNSGLPGGDGVEGATLGPWPTVPRLVSHSGWWKPGSFPPYGALACTLVVLMGSLRPEPDSLPSTLLCFQRFRHHYYTHFVHEVWDWGAGRAVNHGVDEDLSFGSGLMPLTPGEGDQRVG